MKPISIFQIDAFAQRCFQGNPAALVPLPAWLPDSLMQAIAAENQLSETAFFVPDTETDFALRWFTPTHEVDLCGHATLASAWWLFEMGGFRGEEIRFASRSGVLKARRDGDLVQIDLPLRPSHPLDQDELAWHFDWLRALGREPLELRVGERDNSNLIAVFAQASDIRELKPDFHCLKQLYPRGLIVTAPGEDCDFVSRYFAPAHGIDEDPVTGSAHADLSPYWSERLGKQAMLARQLSPRGGELKLQLQGERLLISGSAVLYLSGQIHLPEA